MKPKRRKIKFKAWVNPADVRYAKKQSELQVIKLQCDLKGVQWYPDDVHATITVEWTEK